MAIEASATVLIRKPLEQVYHYTINPAHSKFWYSNVKESELEDAEQGIVVGAKARLLTSIMGADHKFTYEIAAIEPLKSLLMKTTAGPFPMESEYQFKAIDENTTEVKIINRASPKGIPFFMVSIVKGKVQQTMDKDVLTLRDILEQQD